jgi:hypothetical protein
MELFVEVAEAGGLKQSLEAAGAAATGAARVSCVVGDAFMSMAADAGVPWVAVWTGGPCALLAHLRGDALREDIVGHGAINLQAPARVVSPSLRYMSPCILSSFFLSLLQRRAGATSF